MGKKNKRNIRRIDIQSDFVGREANRDKVEYEKLIDNRRDEVESALIVKSKDFRKFNVAIKKEDMDKDKNIVSNKSMNQIKNGFLSTSDKDKYIKQNKEHIKGLPLNDQRNLIKLFLTYM